MPEIKALTFDIWDTLIKDDSDEPKRHAAGRPSKPEERRSLVHRFLQKHQPLERKIVDHVYDAVDAAFDKVWKELFVTWTVSERIDIVLKGLGRELFDDELTDLVTLHEEMELEYMPDLIPGVREALKQLQADYTLGVISDTIFSPGKTLRKILKHYDIIDCFDALIFSDEIGRSKPHGRVFQKAAELLNVEPDYIIHIGDREINDIGGSVLAGARGVLCTAVKAPGKDKSNAAAVFSDYSKLYEIIKGLDN